MCGIAGLFHLQRNPIYAYTLKHMCDAMAHRGPDDEGYVLFGLNDKNSDQDSRIEKGAGTSFFLDKNDWDTCFRDFQECRLGLGHRRLAIIDLTYAGHQPMSNRAKEIWITYNGEIYNFKKLRHELEIKGHHFFSQSDTEVIIHLYEEFGDQAFTTLNGIFALALWDGRKKRLLLVRDRYGAKPLYYTIHDNILCFASEIKALLQVDGVGARLNFRAMSDYFTFQNTFGDVTLFEDIHLLEPGHMLVVQEDDIKKRQYWDFQFAEGKDFGEEHYTNRLRELLSEVIRRQLVSDVPIGSYLSGGLDSGSITAFASKIVPRLMTFTGGFDVATAVSIENFYDEREKAELMSRVFETEHYQMVIHAGDLEWAIPRVIWHMEDLRVGMSYPHWYLSRLASKFVKVVLAGAGGDETLGGYPWRYDMVKMCRSEEEYISTCYRYWCRLIQDEDRRRFFTEDTSKRMFEHIPMNSFMRVLNSNDQVSYFKKALYFDAKTFLHGILVVEDKLSMAHSLESRVPFLDNELVDFTTQIPSKHLVNDIWTPMAEVDINLRGKYILRRAVSGMLPGEIIENRKQGFSAPEQSWYMQQLVKYIRKTILGKRALNRGYFQKNYLENILDEHIQGRRNHRLLIWSLLSFEWWNRIFIDGEKVDS